MEVELYIQSEPITEELLLNQLTERYLLDVVSPQQVGIVSDKADAYMEAYLCIKALSYFVEGWEEDKYEQLLQRTSEFFVLLTDAEIEIYD